jgi:hypothetical protein
VSGDESILEVALDAGSVVPHDCKASATCAPLPAHAQCRARRSLRAALRDGVMQRTMRRGAASERRAGR